MLWLDNSFNYCSWNMIGYDILNLIFFERRWGRGGVRDKYLYFQLVLWGCKQLLPESTSSPESSLVWRVTRHAPNQRRPWGRLFVINFYNWFRKSLVCKSSPARGLQVQSSSCFTICPNNESCFNDGYLFSVKVFGRLLELRSHLLWGWFVQSVEKG